MAVMASKGGASSESYGNSAELHQKDSICMRMVVQLEKASPVMGRQAKAQITCVMVCRMEAVAMDHGGVANHVIGINHHGLDRHVLTFQCLLLPLKAKQRRLRLQNRAM